ncbi:allantoin racemase [Rhodobacter aestuarii]|uniref:Allantoin racemase n=1 Tax=Rhodobacter aestuarii TaxID=453582 RepID=A0A1N7NX48_9RHOB|nr:aspartate/glutamate racemase family protein [Rhodobacter aestuarii]PTV94492.1 allantoin racemase [Rhodobacter aestuarii]SIT02890.1 allantoin racemase [Rhodobacter aestuarii]
MRLLYINPNSTASMTEQVVGVARAALPEAEVMGWTNDNGPPAIQGAADGAAALPGLRALLPKAKDAGVDVIVIACFDDTGLEELRAAAHCPVIGIGQSAYTLGALAFGAFSVVTTLPVSVPVLEENITRLGLEGRCCSVRASGLGVLEVEDGSEPVRARLAAEIEAAVADGAKAVALGCAGMAHLRADLATRTSAALIDGVVASAHLARAITASLA